MTPKELREKRPDLYKIYKQEQKREMDIKCDAWFHVLGLFLIAAVIVLIILWVL